MRRCPYCGHANLDDARQCRKCDAPFVQKTSTLYRPVRVAPRKAANLRNKALLILVTGLVMKVYWGGYGPWPVMDNPSLAEVRVWLEPLFLYGGAALYLVGWGLRFL